MGRKINPVGFRLKINRDWEARWYAEGSRYTEQLQEDFKLRRFIKKAGEKAQVAKIEIERFPGRLQTTIHTARPGILIGQKGQAIKDLKTDLEKLTGKKVDVKVNEIEKPDADAQLIAESIAGQLERRIGHGRAIKRAIQQAMRSGAQGVKIEVSGRLGGSDMARREWAADGRIPRTTLRADVDFARYEALTTYGRIGVKVWIYRGEVLPGEKRVETSRERSLDGADNRGGEGRGRGEGGGRGGRGGRGGSGGGRDGGGGGGEGNNSGGGRGRGGRGGRGTGSGGGSRPGAAGGNRGDQQAPGAGTNTAVSAAGSAE